jgi:hypothetical protein
MGSTGRPRTRSRWRLSRLGRLPRMRLAGEEHEPREDRAGDERPEASSPEDRRQDGGPDGGTDGGPEPRPAPRLPAEAAPRLRVIEPPDLAGMFDATHVSAMQAQTKTQIVGFMELQVGSLAVQVPIRSAEPTPALPLASFEVEGESYAILIRGDSASKAVERAMGDAAREAVAHLSRKLLN